MHCPLTCSPLYFRRISSRDGAAKPEGSGDILPLRPDRSWRVSYRRALVGRKRSWQPICCPHIWHSRGSKTVPDGGLPTWLCNVMQLQHGYISGYCIVATGLWKEELKRLPNSWITLHYDVVHTALTLMSLIVDVWLLALQDALISCIGGKYCNKL